ncbi:hypothetical protein G647_09398 [Cladophialophora carrionii CBS 160.54]|uniref:Uncharacterized protein n=1 Tax=Cladophialophora carrionii CBS 160.54 TaxID=1279043 RepID=V9CY57_9EURO|nr:uncharacterized protein G647_09398 [Cladophialophora carrionii CBS 160.54]ETI19564.1 hypothetical protein G647_09398 [Cladophialophora carrionii CBS 160.54]
MERYQRRSPGPRANTQESVPVKHVDQREGR